METPLVNPRVWVRVRVGVRVRVILIATHRVEPASIPIQHRWASSLRTTTDHLTLYRGCHGPQHGGRVRF